MNTLLDDLREEIKKKQVLIVVGTGVSINATNNHPVASWTGLLRNGVTRCKALLSDLPADWETRLQSESESGDMDDLLSAAEKISSKLQRLGSGEYTRWLRETIGSLSANNRRLIDTITAFDLPILTTNYDTLIEQVTGLPAVSWKDKGRVERVFRGDEKGIIHLHGIWNEPESVILGIRSYETILGHEFIQTILRASLLRNSLLFIGFGAGLRDPNFQALREWIERVLSDSQYRHYRLVCDQEIQAIRKEHGKDRIFPLAFGREHTDLVPFLEQLHPSVPFPNNRIVTLNEQVASIDSRLADLESKRNSLPVREYLTELFQIVADLRGIGYKRSAWDLVRAPFREHASELELRERVKIGLDIAELTLENNFAQDAMYVLEQLESDTQTLSPDDYDSLKVRFWDLQSKGYRDLGAYLQAVESIKQALALAKEQDVQERLTAELAEIHLLHGEIDEAFALSLRR
ncbi:MAG: SIR2 family protein [Candidatus Binatia bacterium]